MCGCILLVSTFSSAVEGVHVAVLGGAHVFGGLEGVLDRDFGAGWREAAESTMRAVRLKPTEAIGMSLLETNPSNVIHYIDTIDPTLDQVGGLFKFS